MATKNITCPHCGFENVFFDYPSPNNTWFSHYTCKKCNGPVGENFEKLKAVPNQQYSSGGVTGPAYFFEVDDGD
jgi:hypothetical protein